MKRFRKMAAAMVLCVVVLCAFSGTVHAASTKSKALAAYKKYLADNVVQRNSRGAIMNSTTCASRFAIIYLNNDSIPELVVERAGLLYSPYVYTYKNGKMTAVEGTMVSASAHLEGYYKKKGCLVLGDESNGYPYHGFSSYYLTLKSGKLSAKLKKQYLGTAKKVVEGPNYYYNKKSGVNTYPEKKISRATFNKKLKDIVGSRKITKIKLLDNTAANRKKACK